ncbi:MAG: sensor histidine kinase, partial [Spirochaetota bacterium]
RHAKDGGQVVASVGPDPQSRGIIITIEDDGPGIPPDERERIFERFYRLDTSRSVGSGGRGLGLSIAREIAKAHGGHITVDASNLGGAAFTVWLPGLDYPCGQK